MFNSNKTVYSTFDSDLTDSRMSKYHRSEAEVKSWLFSLLAIPQSDIDQYKSLNLDLISILKDGILLCQLGNLLQIPGNPCKKVKNSKMPFVQMENISFFLKTCEMIGVPHDEIFQTVDLFDRKDPYQVIVLLISFSRFANQINSSIPIIGPRVAKIKPPVPNKPVRFRAN
ncbi:calponin [Yamadazyma tenuis]|uniref:Calponin-homology (CH) domain-containing protein n=1 Tax=Candida tenuis (strain ATCC 10573 / BCRC 21748 / CBS 615 / JCM 9827 / NBRC 10315 / NRRL Y-1498 / VKM Y-70) TaxID=590646 RepID=G3B2C5_CANTC|nr:uncharacterized protein CANTEDRAFT_113425 [Yamadazyma tenuis ATCC 10573]EGV64645.1 hypothetical protein CANTEDRAFT_113425 [Yamadazyma tenuis ATCC 10573]WEJ97428.1 calponin [Yamadazyma tenuis]